MRFGVDGLRIDTARRVNKIFFRGFLDAAKAFATGEVSNSDPSDTCAYRIYIDSVLNYLLYYSFINAFVSPNVYISDIANIMRTLKSSCKDTSILGTFFENNDVARIAAIISDISRAKNIVAFHVLTEGVPIIYQGQEQRYSVSGDPDNNEAVWLSGYDTDAEVYKFIATVNQIRDKATSDD